MNKKTLAFLLLPFMLMSCSGGSGEASGTTTLPGGGEIIDTPEDADEYDAWLNSWSKPGHVYFHYNRGDKGGYDNYALWLWPQAPVHYEGTLWAFSGDVKVSDKLTLKPMSNHWMSVAETGKDESNTANYIDKFGVIADVDLTRTDLVDGKAGTEVVYDGAEELGFLLPQQDSMDGKTNWVSDGGKETYIEGFDKDENWRQIEGGKTMHIFTSTGALDEYTFFAGSGVPQARVNPIDEDTTGNYRSNVDTTYANSLGNSSTSEEFKELGVGYQIFVASFRDSDGDGTGDIRGIIDALPYLKELGVQVLWLTPIQKSDSYHGYDISDYYAVDKRYGTIEDYQELIYKAHESGMKVLMDLVLNHTSKSNRWFVNSQWGIKDTINNIDWRDVYTWKYETDQIDKYIVEKDANGNIISAGYKKISVKEDALSSNPSWYRDGESHYYYYGKFGSGMPEINYLSTTTRKLVIDMARYWLSFGLDGYRLDAVKHIFMRDECYQKGDLIINDTGTTKPAWDTEKGEFVTKDYDYSSNLTKNIMWWKEFAHGVKNVYPQCFLVGENFDGWGTRTAPYYQALDSQFDFATYYHIASQVFSRIDVDPIGVFKSSHPAETYNVFNTFNVKDDKAIYIDGVKVPGGGRPDFIDGNFTSNHDVMRAINHVNYIDQEEEGEHRGDTTDNPQVDGSGNQVNKAKIHAAITLLGQGVSWIYYGDELGMSSNTNQHSKYNVGNNNIDIWYRQPFKWNDTSIRPNVRAGGFVLELDDYNSTNKVPVMEEQAKSSNPTSMLNWYKDIIKIKKQYPKGHMVSFDESSGGNTLVLNVSGNGSMVKVYINTGGTSTYTMNPGDGFTCIGYTYDAPHTIGGDIGSKPYAVCAFKK